MKAGYGRGLWQQLTACTLKCYECIPESSGSCTDKEIECPSNNQCGSFRTTSYKDDLKFDGAMKTCAVAEHCVEFSFSFGDTRIQNTRKCCTSHLCNSQDVPVAKILSPNGKKCFYCEGQNCTKTLNCYGNEDYCISVTRKGQKGIMKGCASKPQCTSEQIAKLARETSEVVTCCQGNFCNKASKISTASSTCLLFLVALLISLFP